MDRFDIITATTTGFDEDITISSGDFDVAESDQQHIQHGLKADKGQYYQHPLIGLGMRRKLGASITPQRLKQDIKLNLKADDYKPNKVVIDSDFKVFIDAEPLR